MTDLRVKAEQIADEILAPWVTPDYRKEFITAILSYGEEVRRETLEEAAKIADNKLGWSEAGDQRAARIADTIRALAQPKKEATDER